MSVPTSSASGLGPSGKLQALIVGVVALVAVVTALAVTMAGRLA